MPHGEFKTERFNEHPWPVSISKTSCGNAVSGGTGHFTFYLKRHRILSRARNRLFLSLRRARPPYFSVYRAYLISFSSSKARSEVATAFSAEHSFSSPMPLPFFMIRKAPKMHRWHRDVPGALFDKLIVGGGGDPVGAKISTACLFYK